MSRSGRNEVKLIIRSLDGYRAAPPFYELPLGKRQCTRPQLVAFSGAVVVLELRVDGVEIGRAGLRSANGVRAVSRQAPCGQVAVSCDIAVNQQPVRLSAGLVLRAERAILDRC